MIKTTAGTKLFLSAELPEVLGVYHFLDLDFTQLGTITNMGTIGTEYSLATYIPIKSRQVVKRKSSYSNNAFEIEMSTNIDTATRALISQILNMFKESSFKVEFLDGDVLFFTGRIFSKKIVLNDLNQIVSYTVNIEIGSFISKLADKTYIYDPGIYEPGIYEIYNLS